MGSTHHRFNCGSLRSSDRASFFLLCLSVAIFESSFRLFLSQLQRKQRIFCQASNAPPMVMLYGTTSSCTPAAQLLSFPAVQLPCACPAACAWILTPMREPCWLHAPAVAPRRMYTQTARCNGASASVTTRPVTYVIRNLDASSDAATSLRRGSRTWMSPESGE